MKAGAPLNPFSVRFHEPGAVPFRFRGKESAPSLWQRFVACGRRGEIVGPHGTGKTTLLRALEAAALAAGEVLHTVTLHDGEYWPLRVLAPRQGTLIIDGAEQLAPMLWHSLCAWLRISQRGLLVTTHRSLGLPLLHRTAVDQETAGWVVDTVLKQNPLLPKLVTSSAAGEALAACDGNLREALFLLYDRYEERYETARHSGCAIRVSSQAR